MSGIPPDTLRRLVQQTLEAVLKEQGLSGLFGQESSTSPAPTPDPSGATGVGERREKRLLILLTGGAGDLATLRLTLHTLTQQFFLEIVVCPDFSERFGSWNPGLPNGSAQIHSSPGRASALVLLDGVCALGVPLLTRRVAAKASLGIDDDIPSAVLGRALERGLPVVAVRGDADPQSLQAIPAMLQGTNSLRHLLESYAQRLTAWGVRWTTLELFPATLVEALGTRSPVAGKAPAATPPPDRPASLVPKPSRAEPVASAKRRFVTREDLWTLLERGERELRIGPRDIVTPEAEDFAASRGIRIDREPAS